LDFNILNNLEVSKCLSKKDIYDSSFGLVFIGITSATRKKDEGLKKTILSKGFQRAIREK
jgi:hypothetical protein